MGSNSRVNDIDDIEVVERDPTGRYVRYDEILGEEGAIKTVYKGFDEVNGIEIAWTKIEISEKILKLQEQFQSVCSEVDRLKSLKHENIMRYYHSWVDNDDEKKMTVNIVTELSTSGNMSQYRKKHNLIDKKAIKNWARQILKGLHYLHSHNPPIIHRGLNCDSIFVNGYSGKVKIGDLGLSTMLQQVETGRAVGESPAFMAPELFGEDHNQLVDIYSFGMCLLQMVTRVLPYSECSNQGQIYEKVVSGIKPDVLSKVTDPVVKEFIEKCLGPASTRPSAMELLNDPFLAPSDSGSSPRSECVSSLLSRTSSHVASSPTPAASEESLKGMIIENKFKLQGKMEDSESISMNLRINGKRIKFMYFVKTDTSESVVEEMVDKLELTAEDAEVITVLIEDLVRELVPVVSNSCSLADSENSDKISSSYSPWTDVSSQHSMTAESVSVKNQDTKLVYSNGGINHTSMNGFSSSTQQEKQVTEDIRRGDRKCSVKVAKVPSRSLRKLLCFCGNRF
ncbi:probable serine/threonine-protein kinase WNK11 [Spinacia oleracea]|uniref:non-specific serine/threonine protein kinase n=1 Tax=Spinacia oleracea TaxID=3562 RepID=A0A9R0KC36_SPIOL|nr:probable serine/threonine-protein kinase WNK11 [Spinacia oleracea]